MSTNIKITRQKKTLIHVFCSSPVLLYSGGMPRASYGDRHCLTIQQDKDHVTLDFTSRVIDFFTVHNIEPEKGEPPANTNDVYLSCILFSSCHLKAQYHPKVCLIFPHSCSVWWAVCAGGLTGGGAGCNRPPDPRVALFAHSLPGSSALLSHHLLLPHHQRSSQALGKAGQRWQSTAEPSTRAPGEKHAKSHFGRFCNLQSP